MDAGKWLYEPHRSSTLSVEYVVYYLKYGAKFCISNPRFDTDG